MHNKQVNNDAGAKPRMTKPFECLFLNARSLLSNFKLDELAYICKKNNIDIIAVVETWLHSDISNGEINVEGYTIYRRDRGLTKSERGGGILLYISNRIASRLYLSDNVVEMLVVEVGDCNKDGTLLGLCYKPPNASEEYEQLMFTAIQNISSKSLILMGDFNYPNINWEQLSSDRSGELFLALVQDCFLFQHVRMPTRGNNILDLILSTEEGMIEDVSVEEPLNTSDHNLIFFKAITKTISTHTKQEKIFDFNKANYKLINNEIKNIDWNIMFAGLGTEEMWEQFTSTINSIINKHVPVKSQNKKENKPWFNRTIKLAREKKVKAWKKYKKENSPVKLRTFKMLQNQYTNEIRKAKLNYEQKLADIIKTDSKKFYKYVKSNSRVKDSVGTVCSADGVIGREDEQKCQILNNHFVSVFNNNRYDILPEVDVTIGEGHKLETVVFDEATIKHKIKNLKVSKVGGVDKLPAKFLVETSDSIAFPILKIFENSLRIGTIPMQWKMSNVTPIYKSGDRSDPNNYRPVSLTCHICKIFESIIKDTIIGHLEQHDIIKANQHGFTKGKSCLSNLLSFLEFVSDNIDSHCPVDVIFLDFKKAFDRVPFNLLLHKLKSYGIDGCLLEWIGNWLCGRLQRVVLNGHASEWASVKSGVPQGSVLGPVLFSVFINDLGDDIISRILKFADDTKTFNTINNQADALKLQEDLVKINEWAIKWGMEFSNGKCKVMHFGYNNLQTEYFLGGEKLITVEVEKDLGVIVSNDLKVSNQCVKAVKTANRVLGMIKRTFVNRSKSVILPLYKSLVRPHLEYCTQAWRPHLKKDIDMLEAVQHRATKCIQGLHDVPYEDRLQVLHLPSLEYRRHRGDLIEIFRMYKGWSGLNFDDYFIKNNGQLRGHNAKLFKKRFNTNIGKYNFSNRVVDTWNSLPQSIIESNSLNMFKNGIDKILKGKWGKI